MDKNTPLSSLPSSEHEMESKGKDMGMMSPSGVIREVVGVGIAALRQEGVFRIGEGFAGKKICGLGTGNGEQGRSQVEAEARFYPEGSPEGEG